MFYYYDTLLNFTDNLENLYEFYEWEDNDNIEFVKKIPLFKINSATLKTLLKYQVKFNPELVEQIKNKTILKNSNKVIPYCLLVCDTKNSLALELNSNGEVISRSKLLLGDEINLTEIMFTMKESKIEYEKLAKYETKNYLRQVKKIKQLIYYEIKNLYEKQNISKLKYLYIEWFDEINDDLSTIYKRMCEDLKNSFNDKQQNIYDLIKLSYNQVK